MGPIKSVQGTIIPVKLVLSFRISNIQHIMQFLIWNGGNIFDLDTKFPEADGNILS